MFNSTDQNKHLSKVVVFLTITLLIACWFIVKLIDTPQQIFSTSLNELVVSLIPELLGSVLGFYILYLFFFRHGIDFEELLSRKQTKWLKKGYESYEDINWDNYIEASRKIEIVSYYLDKWTILHSDSLNDFVEKRNSAITVYLPNYENPEVLKKLNKLIPKYSPDEFKEKIKSSISELKKRTSNKATRASRLVSIRLFDDIFNYSMHKFDDVMFLSINELCRESDYRSPFIQIDMAQSESLKSFYEQEIRTLEENSTKVNLNSWVVPD